MKKKTFIFLLSIFYILLIILILSIQNLSFSPPMYPNLKQTATCPSPGIPGKEGLLFLGRSDFSCVDSEEKAKEIVANMGTFCRGWTRQMFDEWDIKNCKIWESNGNLVNPNDCLKNTRGPFCATHYYEDIIKMKPWGVDILDWMFEDKKIYCLYTLVTASSQCSTEQSRSNQ